MKIAPEYISAVVLIIVAGFKVFGIEIPSDAVSGIITGVLAIIIAVQRYRKGDITLGGRKV